MGFKPIFEEERQFLKEKTNIELPTDCWRFGTKIYLDITCDKPLYQFKVSDNKIKITKNNTKLFENYKQKKIDELIELNKDNLKRLYNNSFDFLKNYIQSNPNKKWVVSHSGGKDSTITYLVWKNVVDELHNEGVDINYELSFANTSNDTADTYKFVKSLPSDLLNILNPKEGFYQWIKRKNYFIPSALTRNCCSTYKEGQVNKAYDKNEEIVMVLGLRKYESAKRANYDWVMDYDFMYNLFNGTVTLPKQWVKIAPIIEWRDEDIWLYILQNNIPVNRQYKLGFNRCGCLICPYQSDYIDLLTAKYYPVIWNRWINEILPTNYINTHVQERFKWTLKEWQSGKWKLGTSKVFELTKNKGTPERVKQVADILHIEEHIAEKYFKKKCCKCGKKLNPTDVAMNLKLFGREMDNSKMMCKVHLCEEYDIESKKYNDMIVEFRDGGCNLF